MNWMQFYTSVPSVPLTCQDHYLLCHCKTLCLHNSATLQVLTLASQAEKELMAQVDALHITATGSVIAVIINHLLWQSIE